MKTNFPCDVVRDLLPLYAENLASEESRELVEQHLQECPDCASIYRKMTGIEEPKIEEAAEVDYLKKVQRSKKRLLLGAAALVLALGVGVAVWQSIAASRPTVNYDEITETLIISGKSGYDKLTLPAAADEAVYLDAQDDSFHLSAYLPAFGQRIQQNAKEFLPGFLERTDKSYAFIRDYLKQYAPDCYPEENAKKFVDLSIKKKGDYDYSTDDEGITVRAGDYYWHRDDVYVLALMDSERIEWEQIGYANYLAFVLNPYAENQIQDTEYAKSLPYYETFVKLGGTLDNTPENNIKLHHAVSYICLRDGLGHWGSPYESSPVAYYSFFNGPSGKPILGNTMSPAMATSFIGWLSEQYGFANVSAFCFGKASFTEAFGTSYQDAYSAWSDWLMELCG